MCFISTLVIEGFAIELAVESMYKAYRVLDSKMAAIAMAKVNNATP
jgi:hypothetical protein